MSGDSSNPPGLASDMTSTFHLDFVNRVDYLDTVIPARVQKGFSTVENVFTCLCATDNYLVIGSNVGIAYVYNRRTCELNRLRLEGSVHPITCVSCLETVDLMIAMGTSAGIIVVFQIPLEPVPFFEGASRGESSDQTTIKRYLVTELHRRAIQCLVWSQNGMKLFSGDLEGIVMCTEMDYILQQCRSIVVQRESDSIVQLDYHQKMLLVSTRRRAILCSGDSSSDGSGNLDSWINSSSVQIGQKERKVLGNYGACFFISGRPRGETVIFASRPSLRLWKADVDGKVLETFIFKENPPSPTCKVVSVGIDYLVGDASMQQKLDYQFGRIHMFGDRHLLIYNDRQIYVIGVDDLRMVARSDDLGQILSVSNISSNEIFILNGPRRVIRIANTIDHTARGDFSILSKSVNGNSSNGISTSLMMSMPNHLRDIESKLRDSSLTSALFRKLKQTTLSKSSLDLIQPSTDHEKHHFLTDTTHNAMCAISESIEVLRSQDTTTDGPEMSILVNEEVDRLVVDSEPYNVWAPLLDESPTKIDADDDEDGDAFGIVFESKQKRHKKKSSVVLDHNHVNSIVDQELKKVVHLQDVKSINVASRAEKEELLAKMLNLDALLPSKPRSITPPNDNAEMFKSDLQGHLDFDKIVEDELANVRLSEPYGVIVHHPRLTSTKTNSMDYEDIYGACVDDELDSSLNSNPNDSYLSYGPPSGSSTLPSLNSDMVTTKLCQSVQVTPLNAIVSENHKTIDDVVYEQSELSNSNLETNLDCRFGDHWMEHKCPKNVVSLAVCERYVVCTDTREYVYCSSLDGMGLDWHKMDYQAKQMAVSPTGKRVWRIHRDSAFALTSPSSGGPFGFKWIETTLGANHVSVDDSCVWLVTAQGGLLANCELEDNRYCGKLVPVPSPWKVTQVSCFEGIVWILTADGKVACRVGITPEQPLGNRWNPIDFGGGHIFAMSLGMHSIGWIVDATHGLWFKTGLTSKVAPKGIDKKWWQVKITDYVFQPSSVLQTLSNALRERHFHPDQLASFLSPNAGTSPCLAATCERGVWFYNPNNGRLLASGRQVVGHHWHRIDLSKRIPGKLKQLSASGVYHNHGGVWMWPERGQSLCYFNPVSMSVQTCRFPERTRDNPPICLSAAPETLWLLLDYGGIYIRRGIGVHHPLGSDWVALDLTQIADHKLVHVSCGPEVVWACDSQGRVIMRIGAVRAPMPNCLPPAWVPVVDDNPTMQTTPFFIKVYVGPTSNIVWGIDSKHNVYVREGIFIDLLIGVGWVLVSGVQAISLAISELAVYALTSSGMIFRRYNITSNNYIGDYWRELPGLAKILSVTAHDHLWTLDNDGQLLRHLSHVINGSSNISATLTSDSRRLSQIKSTSNSFAEDEWEIVNAS